MKRFLLGFSTLAIAISMFASTALAADKARVRVVHASPDAPAVDVLVNGGKAFTNAPFKGITKYAELDAGTYNVQVVPTGATSPVVIKADLPLKAGQDYTVVAVGKLANIEPIVLTDNNAAPAAGKAHVRFVHASPDAPAVDIAVKGGPVLFANVAFKKASDYLPVNAGAYDLEVRLAGTNNVALAVPGVKLDSGTVYTVFAMGLAGGTPKLEAVASVDAMPTMAALPKSGEPIATSTLVALGLLVGASALSAGIALRRRLVA